MPELPEVETVVRDLRPLVVGRTIQSVTLSRKNLRRPWNPRWTARVRGRTIVALRRRGKWIVLDCNDESALLLHMGMTGQLTVVPRREPADPHVHLRFSLDDGTDELRFRDIRRFGSVDWFASQQELASFLDERLGPEPFEASQEYVASRIQASNRNLKALLLDQSILAGIGNIYADESCFQAGLHPASLGIQLTNQQIKTLHRSIIQVLGVAIQSRGSTIRNYIGGSGLRGEYQEEFRVYGRTGLPCRTCSTPIEAITLAGRSSHYCPRCQPRIDSSESVSR